MSKPSQNPEAGDVNGSMGSQNEENFFFSSKKESSSSVCRKLSRLRAKFFGKRKPTDVTNPEAKKKKVKINYQTMAGM